MSRSIFPLMLLAAAGCQMSPIPERISQWHDQARREVPLLEKVVQPGDIIFRLSSTEVAGGLVDFSKAVAESTRSQMSHASLVYHVGPDGAMVVDMTPSGIQRRYLVDWHVDGTSNIVVRRLKPEYQFLVPKVLAEMDKLIAKDVMYDDKFNPDDDRYYCTELVDHCFRVVGYPLAPRIRIKDFPNYNLLVSTGCLIGGIDVNNLVAIAGNDQIGMFSSPMLETVIDFRGRTPEEVERLLPRTQLVEKEEVNPVPRQGAPFHPAFAPFREPLGTPAPDPIPPAKAAG